MKEVVSHKRAGQCEHCLIARERSSLYALCSASLYCLQGHMLEMIFPSKKVRKHVHHARSSTGCYCISAFPNDVGVPQVSNMLKFILREKHEHVTNNKYSYMHTLINKWPEHNVINPSKSITWLFFIYIIIK